MYMYPTVFFSFNLIHCKEKKRIEYALWQVFFRVFSVKRSNKKILKDK